LLALMRALTAKWSLKRENKRLLAPMRAQMLALAQAAKGALELAWMLARAQMPARASARAQLSGA
jgi:hypothetical protein